MKAVIDTNVLVYDTFEDSIYHEKAKKLLDSLDKWVLPLLVVHEYVWVLKSLDVGIEDTIYKVEEYVRHHKTELTAESPEDVLRGLEIILKEGLSMSRYNDKVILSVAARVGTLATFDEKLRKQATVAKLNVLPHSV